MKNNSSSYEPRLFQGSIDKRNFLQFILVSTGFDVDKLTMDYQDYIFKLAKNEGKLRAVKHCKEVYGLALRYSANLSYDAIPFLRSDKEGFPRALKAHKKFLTGSPDAKRASLTVLQLYKLVEVEGPYTLESITKPYSGISQPSWLETFKQVVLEEFNPSEIHSRIPNEDSLFISGKNGPNGPAMGTLHADFCGLGPLASDIECLAALTGNTVLLELMREIKESVPEGVKHRKKIPAHSRLRVKHEAGGKARVFAILDYFSQSSLEPIHKFLMNWLNSRQEDGTSNHSDAAIAVRKWTEGSSPIWSFDLTTATDRYPVFLQEIVIEAIFGSEIKDCWKKVICNRDFVTPDGKHSVKFAVGQPLGALSSWAAFAVTHHFHIQTAARLSGHKLPFKEYRIIGDDISIHGDAAVAMQYIAMMQDLNVPFSTEKSVLPHQCKSGPVAELAKRLFHKGAERTPVPPDAVISHMREPFGKRILIETSINRGYSRFENPYSVQSLMSLDIDWACLTFPIANTLPPLKGVKVVFDSWDRALDEKPPGSLDPRWDFWYSRPFDPEDLEDDLFESLLGDFLVQQVDSAVRKATEAKYKLYDLTFSPPASSLQGGDWKPGLWELTAPYDHVLTTICEQYNEVITVIRRGIDRKVDPYRLIAVIHSVISPEQMFGRTNFLDEKTKTKAFASRLVKLAVRTLSTGIYPIDTKPFGFRTLKKKLHIK